MEIRCEDCRALIQIPDERVPQNGAFRLNCPRCKRKILANPMPLDRLEGARTSVGLSPSPAGVAPLVSDDAVDDLPDAMDYLPPGQSAALLCVNQSEAYGELQATLEGLGYVVHIPTTADHGLQRLRFNQYDVLLLDDEFEGKSPNPVAGYLTGLHMNTRREMFVVLVGQRFKTANYLQAFLESVNFILHPDDLPQLATFLTRELKDHERFYKVFTECLIEAGKKI